MQPKSYAPEAVLRGYFHAKDENRPHLLEEVFTSDAELVIHNQSENIAFPAVTHGRLAISEVLVRSFTLSYENIYSFYLDRPTVGVREFTCPWLVGMSERASGDIRVGCGTYVWTFEPHAPQLTSRLVTTSGQSCRNSSRGSLTEMISATAKPQHLFSESIVRTSNDRPTYPQAPTCPGSRNA